MTKITDHLNNETTPSLHRDFLNIQNKLQAIRRDTQAFNYKYAPIEKIWEEVKKVITDNGFIVTHQITPKGVKTVAMHPDGSLKSFIPWSNTTLDPQKRGSEITYYKRYNLVAIFNIQLEGEDDDAQQTNAEPFKGNEASKTPQKHTDEACPIEGCDGHLVERQGKYGPFKGCSNYPNCKGMVKIS